MPVVSTCLSAEQALTRLGARRIALVNPAWFDADLDAAGARYFEAAGYEVAHHSPCGLPSGQKHVTPPALFDWIRRIVSDVEVDAVFVGGNGQRAVGVIEAAEAAFGIAVLTANQVLLWDALRRVGEESPVRGYGRLFG